MVVNGHIFNQSQAHRKMVTKRVFEDIVEVIKTEILSNRVQPNHKFGSERSLCKKFKAGRGSIREAIKTLEAIGLVTLRKGRGGGIFVSETASNQATNTLFSLLRLEKSNLLESLEFRKLIEPKMAFYAAIRRKKEDLIPMAKSITQLMKRKSNDEFPDANLIFHLAIAKASRNSFIYSFYQKTFDMLKTTGKLVQNVPGQMDLAIHFHSQIYKAILRKDPYKAEMLMNAHISQLENDIRIARDLEIFEKRRGKSGKPISDTSLFESHSPELKWG
jgi:GntR family transcriptional regulator, transcriptional repressor for pyruvate dehydrogenase complex